MSNGPIASEQLRLFLERIERLNEEIAALKADVKEVFSEAKGQGFDTKTMREVLKLRAMDANTRREREALLDTYKAALGMLDGTPLGSWAVARLTKPKLDPEPAPEGEDPEEDQPAEEEEPPAPPEPDLTVDAARAMGKEAARAGRPVTSNPFPARDVRRAAWDEAWCHELGSDGMDIPDALKPTPKPKKGGGKPGEEGKGE
jgi:uncharacterized protein (UPF0335 family)